MALVSVREHSHKTITFHPRAHNLRRLFRSLILFALSLGNQNSNRDLGRWDNLQPAFEC